MKKLLVTLLMVLIPLSAKSEIGDRYINAYVLIATNRDATDILLFNSKDRPDLIRNLGFIASINGYNLYYIQLKNMGEKSSDQIWALENLRGVSSDVKFFKFDPSTEHTIGGYISRVGLEDKGSALNEAMVVEEALQKTSAICANVFNR